MKRYELIPTDGRANMSQDSVRIFESRHIMWKEIAQEALDQGAVPAPGTYILRGMDSGLYATAKYEQAALALVIE